jgi:hypothetical protein
MSDVKDLINNLDNYQKDWKWYDYLQSKWYRWVWNWVTDLKWKIPTWWQRSFNGWGYADTWCLHCHLSKVIYQSLCHLKIHNHGYPITLKAIDTKELADKDKEKALYNANEETWNLIMSKMIVAFKLASEIGTGEREHYSPKMDKKYQEDYKCLTKKEDKVMKEGMQLFIKHYFHLWD